MTLTDISELTRKYAETRTELGAQLSDLQAALDAVTRVHKPVIRKLLAKAQAQRDAVVAAVDLHRDLFDKPRTQVYHGVRIGLQKGKGAITWDDEAAVVKLIRKHFPDLADTLIKTTEKPVKDALKNLTAAELKRLGVQVTETGDEIVIRPLDSDLDKLVSKLLPDTETVE